MLVPQSNVILTALVHGMRKEEGNDNVRLAATTAMLNSLEFTKNNFQNDVSVESETASSSGEGRSSRAKDTTSCKSSAKPLNRRI